MATIAIDASRAAKTNKTGVEWYSYYLIKELLKIPTEHKYVLYTNKSLSDELFKDVKAEYQVKILNWPIKYFWTLIRLSLQVLVDRPDLLFVPAHNLPILLPKKTIITWHDIGYRRWPMYYSWLQRFSLKLGESGLKHANKIITVSEFSKNEMLEVIGINKEKIKVIPLAVDTNLCFKRDNETQEKVLFKFNIKKSFFIFIGRLEEKKNIVKIIKAFNIFINKTSSSCQLVLIGNPGFGYDKIVEEINNSPYKNQIIKLGWLSQDQVASVFSASNGLVFATNYEGFGIPVLEAHAYQKRAIISKSTAAVELANGNDILVNNESETAIANAMVDLLNDNFEMQDFDQEKYSWQITAKKTLEVINELLSH